MPYFRCPNCNLLVHVPAPAPANPQCSRCHVRLYEDRRRAPRVGSGRWPRA
jgi:uncharacterized paraquat-inducible protein A